MSSSWYKAAEDDKVAKAAGKIFDTWQRTAAGRLTQMVFCDLSTPTTETFNVYHEIKRLLVDKGVPAGEIAFIHDADTNAQKYELFQKLNGGVVRVLFGSTEKMGAGTNAQRLLVELHEIDAPWRPRDVEQRLGRILRQGNTNEEVFLTRYVTEGSFDAYMWQTIEIKARFIAQIMSGSLTAREAEDIAGATLTYAEIKAIASGNPMVVEKVQIDTEIQMVSKLLAAWDHKRHQTRIDAAQGLPQDWGSGGVRHRCG